MRHFVFLRVRAIRFSPHNYFGLKDSQYVKNKKPKPVKFILNFIVCFTAPYCDREKTHRHWRDLVYYYVSTRDGHSKKFPWSIIMKINDQLSINHYFLILKIPMEDKIHPFFLNWIFISRRTYHPTTIFLDKAGKVQLFNLNKRDMWHTQHKSSWAWGSNISVSHGLKHSWASFRNNSK